MKFKIWFGKLLMLCSWMVAVGMVSWGMGYDRGVNDLGAALDYCASSDGIMRAFVNLDPETGQIES